MLSIKSTLTPLDVAVADLVAAARTGVLSSEWVNTFESDGCVLAQDLVSAVNVPPLNNSAMDGYALRFSELQHGSSNASWLIAHRSAAGAHPADLEVGQAARIFTGAPVPQGADTVVMQEWCTVIDRQLYINADQLSHIKPGQSIRRQGEDIAMGQTVLKRGSRLTPQALGVAAAVGAAQLLVARKPRVALFSTGDELVMPGDIAPQDLAQQRPSSIFNSNRFVLKSLLQRLGCKVTDLGIVPDSLDSTELALRLAAQHHDLILTSGGVSVGEEDHIKPAVRALGELDLWSVAIKPGKPFAYGQINVGQGTKSTHFIGLPGNPVSSWVTFLVLVRPFLLALQGAADAAIALQPLAVQANFDWPKPDKRREFLRVALNRHGSLDLFANQGSGVLTSAHWATGLVDNAPSQVIQRGDTVPYLPLSFLF